MKRVAIALEEIASFANLAQAAQRAARGKQARADVQDFFTHFDQRINQLSVDILTGRMPYGRFRQFTIRDPKPRIIHAACFEDRVFHHAVMNFAGPVLERALTATTYACREGMGSHATVEKVQYHLRRFPWYVKIDIEHYFDNIDHLLLHQLLQRRFKETAFLALLWRVITSFHTQPGKGLPIGSLTSQHFANYYLDGLDRFILEQLPTCAQIRYMDDVIWWCESRESARATLHQVADYVAQQRLLNIKDAVQINRSARGVSFCGYRILPGQIRLSPRRQRRYRQLRQHWEQRYLDGEIDALSLQRAYDSVHAITLQADSKTWRQHNLVRYPALAV